MWKHLQNRTGAGDCLQSHGHLDGFADRGMTSVRLGRIMNRIFVIADESDFRQTFHVVVISVSKKKIMGYYEFTPFRLGYKYR